MHSQLPSRTLNAAIVTRLCHEAERLEHVWDIPDLDAGFVTDQMLGVLRFLDKVGRQGRSQPEQVQFASRLLHEFCRQNGRRDTARAGSGRDRGTRPTFLSLNALCETGWDAPAPNPAFQAWEEAQDDLDRRRAVLKFLQQHGCSRARACALIWRLFDGLEWEEVAELLDERFELSVRPAALRQWASRILTSLLPSLLVALRDRGHFAWTGAEAGDVADTRGTHPPRRAQRGTKRPNTTASR